MDNHYRLLEERIETLEREVKELKQQNQISPIQKEVVKPVMTAKQQPAVQTVKPKPVPAVPKPPKKKVDLEKELVQVWLPRTFMIMLLIGILWGLKMGMDNGWITNPVRLVLGYAGTGLLGWFGYKQYKEERIGLGLTMLGGMVALGMLTTFAGHYLYNLFGIWIAFALNLGFVGAGVYLSSKLKSEALAVFSAFGAFLIPFLLENANPNTALFVAYMLVLFLSLFYLSLRSKHKYTYYVIFFLFQVTMLVYGMLNHAEANELLLAFGVMVQHFFVVGMYVKGKISQRIFSEVFLYTNFVFGMGWLKILEETTEPYVYGGVAILYILLAYQFFKKRNLAAQSIFTAISVFAVGLWIASFNFNEEYVYAFLFLLNGTVGLWIALQFKSIRSIVTSGSIFGLTSMYILIQELHFFISKEHLLWLAFLGAIVTVYIALFRYLPKHYGVSTKALSISLIAGQLISMVYLTSMTMAAIPEMGGYDTFQERIVFGVIILSLFGYFSAHKWKYGKFLSYAAIVELLLFFPVMLFTGLQEYDGESLFYFNLAIDMIYVGFLFYFMRLIWNKQFPNYPAFLKKATPFLAVGMQLTLFVFLNKWVLSATDFWGIPSDYVYFIHSIILMLFAFGSISLGKSLKLKAVRNIGFVLILITILKLIFVDLGQVSILIRALLFIVVGVIGIWYSKSFYNKEE